MRFHEIFGINEYSEYKSIKRGNWSDSDQLKQWLNDNDFEKIGEGANSIVYRKPCTLMFVRYGICMSAYARSIAFFIPFAIEFIGQQPQVYYSEDLPLWE